MRCRGWRGGPRSARMADMNPATDETPHVAEASGSPAARFVAPPGFTRLSVVLPCYRLGARIADNLRAVAALLAPIPHELVPVDDGSGDGTPAAFDEVVRELGPDRVRPVVLPENRGKGEALREGFEHARGSHVLLLDGDLDLDPSFVWRFFEIMRERKADVVIGSKLHPESRIDYPWQRRVASFVYYTLVKVLVRLPVHDTQTGMKLFTRDALAYAFSRMLSKRFAFDLEVLSIARDAGYRIAEAPVGLDYRGKMGSLTFRNVRDVMVDTLAIFYRTRLLGYYKAVEVRPMPADPPSVTAVIACPGASAMLRQCVEALGAQRAAYPKLDAIVLPDAATGEAWPDWVRELPTGKVLPSDKRNLGIREARGEIVAFLDDDARPLEGWLEHAIPYFSDPATGAVGGPAVTPPEDPFAAKMSGRVYASPLVSGGARRRYVPTRVRSEDDLPSCNLLVRADLLREIGGYDTAHWPGEDTILCLEIVHRRRRRMVYDPWVAVAHHRRPLFGPHLRQVSRYARHRGYFAKKFPETSRRLAYFVPSLLLLGMLGTALCTIAWLALGDVAMVRAAPHGAAAKASRVFGLLATIGDGVILLYFALVALLSFSTRLRVWAWTAAGTVATHYAYGWNFLRGLFAPSMPDGVRSFDHQGKPS